PLFGFSVPWHLKQELARIGRTFFSKNAAASALGGAGLAGSPAATGTPAAARSRKLIAMAVLRRFVSAGTARIPSSSRRLGIAACFLICRREDDSKAFALLLPFQRRQSFLQKVNARTQTVAFIVSLAPGHREGLLSKVPTDPGVGAGRCSALACPAR